MSGKRRVRVYFVERYPTFVLVDEDDRDENDAAPDGYVEADAATLERWQRAWADFVTVQREIGEATQCAGDAPLTPEELSEEYQRRDDAGMLLPASRREMSRSAIRARRTGG